MLLPNIRAPNEIISTKGYVSFLEGEPGVGKTTFALASALAAGKVKYISYNEPRESLVKKAKRALNKDPEGLEVIHMLSGKSEKAFSEIVNALDEGKTVILDSVDAFLWGEGGQQNERSLLQIIYEAVKLRNGSLVLITEGAGGISNMLKFVVDAYLKMETENILDINARKIRVLKDRDYPVGNYPFYYTLYNGFEIMSASYFLDIDELMHRKVKQWERPFGTKSVMSGPELFLYVLGNSVSVPFSRLYRSWLAMDYLKRNSSVVFAVRPDENPEGIMKSIKIMSGADAGLNVVKLTGNIRDDKKVLESYKGIMLIADAIVWEHVASGKPSLYESFIRSLVGHNLKTNSGMILFSYKTYGGLEILEKYATREREIVESKNNIFLRTIRPPGPLYYVKIEEAPEPELRLIQIM